MNHQLVEGLQIASGFVPVDLATASNPGDWMSLKNYRRCAVVVFKGAGAAGQDPSITLEQATDVSGANAKALNFTRVDEKVGTLTAQGEFVTKTFSATNVYTNADSGEAQAIFVIDIESATLDIDNGFDCLRATVGDPGATAQLGCMLYLLHEPIGTADGGVLPSALTN